MPTAVDHIASPKERLREQGRARSPRELTENTHPHLPDPYLLDHLRRAREDRDLLHRDADDLKVALDRMAEIEKEGVIPLNELKKELGL